MKDERKIIVKRSIYGLLSLLQIATLGFSLMIYTSFNKSLPWYESCGLQFLTIFMFSIPMLIAVGVGFLFLGRKYTLSKVEIGFPFVSAALILAPIIDGSLNRVLVGIGAVVCAVLMALSIYLPVSHYRRVAVEKKTISVTENETR